MTTSWNLANNSCSSVLHPLWPLVLGGWHTVIQRVAVIQPRSNDGASDALCNITRQRAPELSQELEMKVASPDCSRCQLSIKRHRRVACDIEKGTKGMWGMWRTDRWTNDAFSLVNVSDNMCNMIILVLVWPTSVNFWWRCAWKSTFTVTFLFATFHLFTSHLLPLLLVHMVLSNLKFLRLSDFELIAYGWTDGQTDGRGATLYAASTKGRIICRLQTDFGSSDLWSNS